MKLTIAINLGRTMKQPVEQREKRWEIRGVGTTLLSPAAGAEMYQVSSMMER